MIGILGGCTAFILNGWLMSAAHCQHPNPYLVVQPIDVVVVQPMSGQSMTLAADPPSVGDVVAGIGFSRSGEERTHTVSAGRVLSNNLAGPLPFRPPTMVTGEMDLGMGSSGGPIINADGEVVGVHLGIYREKFRYHVNHRQLKNLIESLSAMRD